MTDAVSQEMQVVINKRLQEIAKEENILILFAVESGSRAWGFHSPDSDYDVRFVYARPIEWHLALEKKRDVIERPIDAELDLSGWELRKALELALTSNAVIAEWLQSPIVYQSVDGAMQEIASFAEKVLDRKSVSWHYLALMQRQEKRLRDDLGRIRLKRYFYMLRPTLALRWMRLNDQAMPPMAMQELIGGCQLSLAETDALAGLTHLKQNARESKYIDRVDPLLDMLISRERNYTEDWLKCAPRTKQTLDFRRQASLLHERFTFLAGGIEENH